MSTAESLGSETAARGSQDCVVLRLIDHERNCFRIYRMTECHDLFGEICLFLEWGRIGRPLRSRLEPFPDIAARAVRKRELVLRRRRHGYLE